MSKAEPVKQEKKYGKFDKYELEGFVRTLEEAEVIKQDKEKMAAIEPMLKKKVKAITSLSELRAKAREVEEEEMEEDED